MNAQTTGAAAPAKDAWFDEMFQPAGIVSFEFEGKTFHAKCPSIEDLARDFGPMKDPSTVDNLRRSCELLARCLVDAAGNPLKTADEYLRTSAVHQKRLTGLGMKLQEVIGLREPKAVEELGNASTPTTD